MILGTAGHIDHGKTALVKALTGVDTDRLPEEKRRGITIDLGFAPLRIGDHTIGVVDVPGHEGFVRTMLAGATGIDVALLVIAADEGPMPQTREHLAILKLLAVPALIVALTKVDLVDADWLKLVADDVRKLVDEQGVFGDVKILPVSAVTNQGIDELRVAIGVHVSLPPSGAENTTRSRHSPRPAEDLFRLPVDRAFSVKGTGTVVTGTVWSGHLTNDETVRIMPLGISARVRGIQSHGESVETVGGGSRAAIALVGVEPKELSRGATLVTLPQWEATQLVRADLTLFADGPELRPRTKVRFHLATSDVGARVVAAGSPVKPGTARSVRIALDEPVIARTGDRFVIRSASPLATIGGGVITDATAPRRARPLPEMHMALAECLALFVDEAGLRGLPEATLPVKLGILPAPLERFGIATAELTLINQRWYSNRNLEAARQKIVELVTAHHDANPLATGVPREDVRSRLGIEAVLFDHLARELVGAKRIDAGGAELRVAGRVPELTDKQRKATAEMLAVIEAAGSEPPSVAELQTRFGTHTVPLLRHLEREKRVVQVEDGRFYSHAAFTQLLSRLESGMAGKGEVAPSELREVLGFSRKFLIPFLEYCDKRGYTQRREKGRVWRGVSSRG